MASITGKSKDNTFRDFLRFENSGTGADATLRTIEDGAGNSLALKLSTDKVALNGSLSLNNNKIINVSSSTTFEDINGNTILKFTPVAETDSFINMNNRAAADGGPYIDIESTATDCEIGIQSKGSGRTYVKNLAFSYNAQGGAGLNKLYNLADPVDDRDAATKKYVDDEDALLLKTDGSRAVSGDLTVEGTLNATDLKINGYTPTRGYKNWIQNPKFAIWQRVANRTGDGFCADRWFQWADGTVTATPTDNTGHTLGAGTGITTASTVKPTYHWLSQHIFDGALFALAGKTCTVSFWIWVNVAVTGTVPVRVDQAFGAGGSATVYTDAGTYTISQTETWEKKSLTFTVPSISGKTVGANDINRRVVLNIGLPSPNFATTGSVYLTMAQFEIGPETPFEHRPEAIEQVLCESLYQKSYSPGVYAGATPPSSDEGFMHDGAASAWAPGQATIAFPTKMKFTPIMTIYGSKSGTADAVSNMDTIPATDRAASYSATERNFHIWSFSGSFGEGERIGWHWVAYCE